MEHVAHGRRSPWLSDLIGPYLQVGDDDVTALFRFVRDRPERPLRIKLLDQVWLIRHSGSRSQRKRAAELLRDLAEDRDPLLAVAAQQWRDRPWKGNEPHWARVDWDIKASEVFNWLP